MNELNEVIGAFRQMELEFDRNAASNEQMVMGKQRRVCVMCGHCPSALLQGLEAAREALSNESKTRSNNGIAAKEEEV